MKEIKIVYIEDDKEDIFLFQQHLKRLNDWHLNFLPIIDIENAIHQLLDLDPDVIFLDYYLKEITGIEVLSALRGFGLNPPVVFLTDKELSLDEIKDVKGLGSCDFISKSSFNTSSLNDILENVYDNLKYQPLEVGLKDQGLKQLSIFTNDGKLLYAATVEDGKFVIFDQETSSRTLFAASLFIVNNFITETSGSSTPFNEMKTKDMVLTFERGEKIGICLVSKQANTRIRKEMTEIINDIEIRFHDHLAKLNGTVNQFDISPYLDRLNNFIY